MSEVVELADEVIDYGPCGGERSLTLIIYEIFRQKSGTEAVKTESKSKPPLLADVRLFSFPSGQRVQNAETGHKKKRATTFVPLFVPLFVLLFACRHFSYIHCYLRCR
jgi:hypothetical protein